MGRAFIFACRTVWYMIFAIARDSVRGQIGAFNNRQRANIFLMICHFLAAMASFGSGSSAYAEEQPPGVEWSQVPIMQNPNQYLKSTHNSIWHSDAPIALVEDPLAQKIVQKIKQMNPSPFVLVALLNQYFVNNFKYGRPTKKEKQDCVDSVPATLASRKTELCRYGSSWLTLRLHKGDCLGAAYAMAALLRAAGIPTLISYTRAKHYSDSSLAYIIGGGYGAVAHYYNYFYLNGSWYFLEPQEILYSLKKYPPAQVWYKFSHFQED